MRTFRFKCGVVALSVLSGEQACAFLQDDGLDGPPPPIPHVGPVSRPLMTVAEDFRGACGPTAFDLSLTQIERSPGLNSYNTTVTRWKVTTKDGTSVEVPRLPKNSFVRDVDLGCNGEDRLLVTLTIILAYDEGMQQRLIQYEPSGVTYDFTRNAEMP